MNNYQMNQEALLREQDLVNNPSARVPICLCLDTSGSMGRVLKGTGRYTGKRVFRDGQWWNIVEGGTTALDQLEEGVKTFYDSLQQDNIAKYSAEVCVVTFGEEAPKLIADFNTIYLQPRLPKLKFKGDTPMGQAVNMALDCLERRKQEYQRAGVDYFQPWLVLMTDGTPTDADSYEFKAAVSRSNQLIQAKKLSIFPIGIGAEADMQTLAKFSPKRNPLRLDETHFKDFFEWLSQSVAATSMSMPGEEIDYDDIMDWDSLDF